MTSFSLFLSLSTAVSTLVKVFLNKGKFFDNKIPVINSALAAHMFKPVTCPKLCYFLVLLYRLSLSMK